MKNDKRRVGRQKIRKQEDSLVHLNLNGEVVEGRIDNMSIYGFRLNLNTEKPLPENLEAQNAIGPITGSMWVKHIHSSFDFSGRIVWTGPGPYEENNLPDGEQPKWLGFEFAPEVELPGNLVAAVLSDDLVV